MKILEYRGFAENGWTNGLLISYDTDNELAIIGEYNSHVDEINGVHVDFESVSFSSGLKDSNGNTIYTKDVLGDENGNVVPFEVVFENGCFRAKENDTNSSNSILTQDRVSRLIILGDTYYNSIEDFEN